MTVPSQPSRPTSRLRRPPAPRPSAGGVTRLTPSAPVAGPVVPVEGTLALDLGPALPARPEPPLYAVPAAPGGPGAADELQAWASRFAQAVVEVTGGDRPLTQLLRWTSPRVYAELGRRVRIMAQNRPATTRRRTVRPQVRSVHVFQPEPTCAEVSVHVRYGQRSRAIAARLERRRGHWTCTELLVG